MEYRKLAEGIGEAVAKRTFLRKLDNGEYENWGQVATRVSKGNTLLHPSGTNDEETLRYLIAKGAIMLSGRQLQHGDEDQPNQKMEKYTNCFDGETEIMTLEHGSVCFKDVVGEVVTTKSRDGEWRECLVSHHGKQDVYKLSFTPRLYIEGNYKIDVVATRNHRWIKENGEITNHIEIGDFIEVVNSIEEMDEDGIRHGLVYGDGSNHQKKNKNEYGVVTQGKEYASIRLCGEKKEYLKYFNGFSVKYPPHANGDPVVYVGRKPFLKDLPYTTDPKYISGFIYGWWLADGGKHYSKRRDGYEIYTTDERAKDWLFKYAAYAGYLINGMSVRHRTPKKDGTYNESTLFCIRFSCGQRRKLNAIEYIGERDVYCLEERVTGGFVLANGLKTGNCSTALTTHMLFYLALNGSGIGTSYDDEFIVVDWNLAPQVICLISENHPDYEKCQTALKKEDWEGRVDLVVDDSREGWAKAVEMLEIKAFKKENKKPFVLDFSNVRCEGSPIRGMQNRPASGPAPLILAFNEVTKLRNSGLSPWEVKMHVDHHFGACVMFGGVRRVARACYKYWKDKEIFRFIDIKKTGNLWSANNSIAVDQEFWDGCLAGDSKCLMILGAATEAAYYHNSGEPGLLNIDKLVENNEGLDKYLTGEYKIGSEKYTPSKDAQAINKSIFKRLIKSKYKNGVNPCIPDYTLINTSDGWKTVKELIGKPFKAVVNGKEYNSGGFFQTGRKKTMVITTKGGQRIECTPNHKILTPNEKWVQACDLKRGDLIITGDGHSTEVYERLFPIQPVMNVYDCTVEEVHRFEALDPLSLNHSKGIIIHNCFEISLQHNSGFCVLSDIFGYNADSLEEVIQSIYHSVRATIRLNLMDSVYRDEVLRTNRIGISFVGWHEFAWKFFRYGFKDLLDEEKTKDFWMFINSLNEIAHEEAERYSKELGVSVPHTVTTVKPAGSTSKIWGLTEGIHLPAMREYLRWVQFSANDPLVDEYELKGYPVRRNLKSYANSSIVGFPTQPEICRIGMGDKLVTAGEASMEEQYKWLSLIEKYWIIGVNEDGSVRDNRGNQISATIKFKPESVSYAEFYNTVLEWQPKIKCASIMPQIDATVYEYQPEQPISEEYYYELMNNISLAEEDIGYEHLVCEGGYCPIDFKA